MAALNPASRAAAALYGAAWEVRRRSYALGFRRAQHVPARVVSVGNLTLGGTGKTTLTLHLARVAMEMGRKVAVVCRDYRPGPGGQGDETLLYRRALGETRVFSGRRKVDLAAAAAASGHDPILVDDGFSHWPLARDLDLVLLDAASPWGGGGLLPAGRLREPRRALQRADWLILTRVIPPLDRDHVASIRRYAPAARFAAGRHRVTGVRHLDGSPAAAPGRVRVVTATGHPEAVAASAREAGLEVTELSAYRDHHWFRREEAERERAAARRAGAALLMTAKDAVRWPHPGDAEVRVLEVEWEWVEGGAALIQDALPGKSEG
ncbi:MAG TPA: tetraacyldisaccharide 4'-kinase [Candidatus Eisenbacteria bacterium]|nr:tetraacyldisaccharide 4'-kinase [Candidatus Eisenbacteria bacterium]